MVVSSSSMRMEATFQNGYVETTEDALFIIQNVMDNNLPAIPRRPHDREREGLIRSGNVFVFIEEKSGIKRWTDGVSWSPSRILGRFLVYRELDRQAMSNIKGKSMEGSGSQRSSNDKKLMGKKRSIDQTSSGDMTLNGSHDSLTSSGLVPPQSGHLTPKKQSSTIVHNRQLVGSLVASPAFKETGLIKKTISLSVKRKNQEGYINSQQTPSAETFHLVSYYTAFDVDNKRLRKPSAFLNGTKLSEEVMAAAKDSPLGSKVPLEEELFGENSAAALNGDLHGLSHYQPLQLQQQQLQVPQLQQQQLQHQQPQMGHDYQLPVAPYFPSATSFSPVYPNYMAPTVHTQSQPHQSRPMHPPPIQSHQSAPSFPLPKPLSGSSNSSQQADHYFSEYNGSGATQLPQQQQQSQSQQQQQPQSQQQQQQQTPSHTPFRYSPNQNFVPSASSSFSTQSSSYSIMSQTGNSSQNFYQSQPPLVNQNSNASSTTSYGQKSTGSPSSPPNKLLKVEQSPLASSAATVFNSNPAMNLHSITPRDNTYQSSVPVVPSMVNSSYPSSNTNHHGAIHTSNIPQGMDLVSGSNSMATNNGRMFYDENGQIAGGNYVAGFQAYAPQNQ